MTARDEVLARIRTALAPGGDLAARPGSAADGGGVSGGPVPAGYRTRGDLRGPELLDLLASRLADYRAIVRRATPATLTAEISAALSEALSAALAERGSCRLVVPPGLNIELPRSADVTVDAGLTAEELDRYDGVVSRAAVAIAETGTIVLDGSPDQGRRAITLVPDYHLCVVEASQVVHLVPEAVDRLASAAGRPLTWISGPSATSDIELERVEGVHGPRTLEVVLVAD
jgi:L-lactate dehydrogenase complex protein LldG